MLSLEIDRRTEDAHDLVTKLRRYWDWGRLLPRDADKHTVDLVRSRPDATENVDHEKRLWRRAYLPTGWEGPVPLAFVFADTTQAKDANTVAVLEEAGRRYWVPCRDRGLYREAITAKDYGQAVPVVVTILEQLQEHGADAAVWRRLGRRGEQTLTAALDSPDGDVLSREQEARADAEGERRRAAEREVQRPVCKRCGQKSCFLTVLNQGPQIWPADQQGCGRRDEAGRRCRGPAAASATVHTIGSFGFCVCLRHRTSPALVAV